MAVIRHSIYTLVLLPAVVLGQMGPPYNRVKALDDHDVLDAFAIRDVVFVYRRSDLPDEKTAVNDLSKIIPVDQAEVHGEPGPEMRALIDLMLRHPHSPRLNEISAVHHGDAGYVWKVTWELFPSQGGFSGIPYQYREHVNPDGSPINPELYLCSHVKTVSQTKSDETEAIEISDEHIFSVLSFADFNVPIDPAKKIHGDEVLSLATKAINNLLSDVDTNEQQQAFRFHDQTLLNIPVGTNNDGNVVARKVWAVNFKDSNIAGDAIEYAAPLTVWVTPDGMVSELSQARWQARKRREK